MWYFTWVLGLTMAIFFAVLNAIWHESEPEEDRKDRT
jgi:cyd operon protein YbgT